MKSKGRISFRDVKNCSATLEIVVRELEKFDALSYHYHRLLGHEKKKSQKIIEVQCRVK